MNLTNTIINKIPHRHKAQMVKHQKFLVYAAIGGLAVVVDMGLFALLAGALEISSLIANVTSTGTAMIYSFIANSFINFKTRDKLLQRFVSFCAVTVFGLAVSSVMLLVFTESIGFNALFVKAASLPVVLVVQFVLNNRFTFKESLDSSDIIKGEEK